MRRFAILLMISVGFAAFQTGCDSTLATGLREKIAVDDPIDPTAPENASVVFDRILNEALEVSWPPASDNWSTAEELEYLIVYSLSENDVTGEAMESSGIIVADWTPGLTEATIAGLTVDTRYYVNVAVRDRGDNTIYYTVSSATTANDPISPDPGGAVVPTAGTESIGLAWPAATDNITKLEEIEYRVLVSCSNPVDPLTDFESMGWAVNTLSHTITGLVDDIEYEITVQARDAVLNEASYAIITPSTLKHPRLFYAESGTADRVSWVETDGTGGATLVDSGISNALGVAVDPINRRIYYVDSVENNIQSCDFNGNDPQVVITGLNDPTGIAVDWTGPDRYLYFTDQAASLIYRTALPPVDSDPSDNILLSSANGVDLPMGIEVDEATGDFFWAQVSTALANPRIRQAAAATPTVITDVITSVDLTFPVDVALDHINDRIYWSDYGSISAGSDTISSRSYSIGTIDVLVDTNLGFPYGVAIDTENTVLYFSDSIQNALYRYDVAASPSSTDAADFVIAGSLSEPRDVVLY